MLRWLFGKRRENAAAQTLQALVGMADQQLALIERSRDPASAALPLHRCGAKLKLAAPMGEPGPGDSWLGGSPYLPDPFVWPEVDGAPLHFLGQIACAALPEEIWGGEGPRNGYLAFFAGYPGTLVARVLHAAKLGPERRAPAPWPEAFPTTSGIKGKFRPLYERMPQWRLETAPASPDDAERKQRILNNERRFPEVDLQNPAFRPHDARTLALMLECAETMPLTRAERDREDLAYVEARAKLPPPDLALRERMVAEAREMRERIDKLTSQAPFQPDLWRPFAEQTATWRKALARDKLRRDGDLSYASQALRESIEELLEVCSKQLVLKPGIAKRLTLIRDRTWAALKDPQWQARIKGAYAQARPGVLVWRGLADEFPEDWSRVAKQMNDDFGAVVDAETQLRPVEWRIYRNGEPRPAWGKAWLFQNSFPTSWEEATGFVDGYVEQAAKNLQDARDSATHDAEERAKLQARILEQEAKAAHWSALAEKVKRAAASAPFQLTDWAREMALAEEDEDCRFWAHQYEALRYRLAAFDYAKDPDSLPAPVRSHFEARWANDRNYEVAGMGGLPVGWSEAMMEGVGKRALLLELPSSYLIGWQWGDVNGLVIHAPAKDLRKMRFDNIVAHVTN